MAEPQVETTEQTEEEIFESPFQHAESVEELLAQFGGAASQCWENTAGAGEFKSDHLAYFLDEALKRLQDLVRTSLAEYVVESAGELAAFFPIFGLPGERAEILDEIDEEDEAEEPVTDEE